MKQIHWIILGFIVLVVVAVISISSDEPTMSESIDNAAGEISEGLENAAEELDPHRSPAEKAGDAIEDFGQDIQDAAE